MRGARGMVITVEIKHHQLWGSTFQCPSLSFPFQSPFITRSNSNGPRCHSLRPSALPPALLIFFHYFPPRSTPLHILASLPSHLFSFNFLHLTPPSRFIYPHFVFPVFRNAPSYSVPNLMAKCALLPILCAPPNAHLHTNMHAGAHTNHRIRQMTLITVCLECKNTEKLGPKHLLHIPYGFRDFSLCCLANTNSLPALHWINEFKCFRPV